ncbi:MAG: fibronectin type III domain-containing protein [Bryobacteraceae bacterium]
MSIGFQDAAGTIQVTTNVAAASFTAKGPSTYTGSGPFFTKTNAPAGTYTITYGVVPGYTTPVSETKALTAGGIIAFTGSYAPLPGIGRIQVTTNLDSATFTVVAVTATPGFTVFTSSGRFYDSGLTIPAGTYQISFTALSGYITPPSQILTVGAGGTLQFTGTYKRIVVVLFTGWNNRPTPGTTPDGVTYPDECAPDNCPGVNQLAVRLRANATLQQGIVAETFTFYDLGQYQAHPPSGNPGSCLLHPTNAECLAPASDGTDAPHQVANNWIKNVARPGPDDRIVVVGHSYGGNRARLFAEQLPLIGYATDLLVTIDPIDWYTCSLQEVLQGIPGILHECRQFDAPYTQTKQPAIHDVQAFAQARSALVMGYHFLDYPFDLKEISSCGVNDTIPGYCSHMAIDDDSGVHDSIVSRIMGLKDTSQEPIYDVSAASIGTTSVTITWKTAATRSGGVVYSKNSDAATGSVEVSETTGAGTSHSATISGLIANTRYYFRIRARIPGSTNSQYSSSRFFQTGQVAPVIKASSPVLTRGASGTSLTVTLTNSGANATNGTMTAASIGAAKATSSFPLPIPDLATGTSFYPVIPFPANVGATGATVVPIITVKYSGSTFAVPVPPVKVS